MEHTLETYMRMPFKEWQERCIKSRKLITSEYKKCKDKASLNELNKRPCFGVDIPLDFDPKGDISEIKPKRTSSPSMSFYFKTEKGCQDFINRFDAWTWLECYYY